MQRPPKLDWSVLLINKEDRAAAESNIKAMTDLFEKCLDEGAEFVKAGGGSRQMIRNYVRQWVYQYGWRVGTSIGSKVTQEHFCEVMEEQLWIYRPYSKDFVVRPWIICGDLNVSEVLGEDELIEPKSIELMKEELIDTAERRLAGGADYGWIYPAPFIILDNVPRPLSVETLHEAIDQSEDKRPLVKAYVTAVERDQPLEDEMEE